MYLRTTLSIAHSRMLSRALPEENSVTLQYLEGLHQLHEAWIEQVRMKGVPVSNQFVGRRDQRVYQQHLVGADGIQCIVVSNKKIQDKKDCRFIGVAKQNNHDFISPLIDCHDFKLISQNTPPDSRSHET